MLKISSLMGWLYPGSVEDSCCHIKNWIPALVLIYATLPMIAGCSSSGNNNTDSGFDTDKDFFQDADLLDMGKDNQDDYYGFCSRFEYTVSGDSCDQKICSGILCEECYRSIVACTLDGCITGANCSQICAADSIKIAIDCTDVYTVVGPKENGRPCNADAECKSTRCSNPPGSNGVCIEGLVGDPCYDESDCLTQICKDGSCIKWAIASYRQFGTTQSDTVTDVAIDPEGNLLLNGQFGLGIDFGNGTLNQAGMGVAKLTPDGTEIWAKAFNHTSWGKICVDYNANIYVAGPLTDSVNFGGNTLNPAVPYDSNIGSTAFFVVKFDANGEHIWSTSFDSNNSYIAVRAIAVDSSGNPTITGVFKGSVDFGNGTFNNTGEIYDIFLLHLTPSSNVNWSRHFFTDKSEESKAIQTDNEDNLLLGGQHRGNIDFGGEPLNSQIGNSVGFAVKLGNSGSHVWSETIDSPDYPVQMIDIAVTTEGDLVGVGGFGGVLSLGSEPQAESYPNVFIAKFAAAGDLSWVTHIPSLGDERPTSVATSPTGEILVGSARDTVDHQTEYHMIYKLSSTGVVLRSRNVAFLENGSASFTVVWGKHNTPTLVGFFDGTLVIDDTENVTSNGSRDICLVFLEP